MILWFRVNGLKFQRWHLFLHNFGQHIILILKLNDLRSRTLFRWDRPRSFHSWYRLSPFTAHIWWLSRNFTLWPRGTPLSQDLVNLTEERFRHHNFFTNWRVYNWQLEPSLVTFRTTPHLLFFQKTLPPLYRVRMLILWKVFSFLLASGNRVQGKEWSCTWFVDFIICIVDGQAWWFDLWLPIYYVLNLFILFW